MVPRLDQPCSDGLARRWEAKARCWETEVEAGEVEDVLEAEVRVLPSAVILYAPLGRRLQAASRVTHLHLEPLQLAARRTDRIPLALFDLAPDVCLCRL